MVVHPTQATKKEHGILILNVPCSFCLLFQHFFYIEVNPSFLRPPGSASYTYNRYSGQAQSISCTPCHPMCRRTPYNGYGFSPWLLWTFGFQIQCPFCGQPAYHSTEQSKGPHRYAGEQRRFSANRDFFVTFGHCIKDHNLSSPYIKKQDNPRGLSCKSKGRASEDTLPVVHIIFCLADAKLFHQPSAVLLIF